MTKVEEIKNNFIKETYQDIWNVYSKTLENNSEMPIWDYIVLTASNKEQANTYEKEINYRLKRNYLPKKTKYLVVEDPDGKRVGSGGATLNVMKAINEKYNDFIFENRKVLVIHSGGDSKRIPQYSSCGKLFSPVQRELLDGRASTLFDEFIIAFSSVPSRMSPGMIVLSGDVLLVFNPLQIDLQYVDSAAISIKAPVETGCNHGVFLTDKNDEVKKFLHKQSIESLTKIGAVNDKKMVDIDTGAIYFGSKILKELYRLISQNNEIEKEKFNFFVNEESRISFYGDFLYPIAKDATLDNYFKEAAEGTMNEKLLQCRKLIWKSLSKYKMRVIKLSPAEFIHFGTTKELFDLLINKIDKYKSLGWNKTVLSNMINTEYVVNHSYVDENSNVDKNVYIENSNIGKNVIIGKNSILSNVMIENINIPSNICLNTIITKDNKYVTRIYSINENPKIIKANETIFLNNSLENMMKKYNILEKDIWKGNDKSLWKADFYTVENTNFESINSAIKLYQIMNCQSNNEDVEKYFRKKRTSLCDSFNSSDTTKIKKRNDEVEIKIRSYKFINMIINRKNLDITKKILLQSPNLEKQINNLIKEADNYNYSIKSRVFLTISKIIKEENLKKWSSQLFEDKCYEEIKKVISNKNSININKDKIKEYSKIELPVRVNFGGGWSDTPPYCNENGGIVLNGAFKLNGQNPIKVMIRKNKDKNIKFKSIDLNIETEIKNIEELKICNNTNDVFALLKASLLTAGIVKDNDMSINAVIKRIGTGIEFITEAKLIPKGSGLGTSSILAGACLKAIYDFLNIEITDEELAYKTLEQEQLMGTGGGWQDQIGGIIPGIKCTYTEPGEIQKFNIQRLKVSKQFKKQIDNRFVLIYTGQRRLAKNLLRDIMNKYISYDTKTIKTIEQIKNKAIEMKESLEKQNMDSFCQLLNEHWELSKELDKGCTNICIDQILNSCKDLIAGQMICGAGGGGFLQVVLKEGISKKILRNRIKDIFQDSGIKIFDIELFEGGN